MQCVLFRHFSGFINLLKEIEICQTTVAFSVTLLELYSDMFKRAHTAVTEKAVIFYICAKELSCFVATSIVGCTSECVCTILKLRESYTLFTVHRDSFLLWIGTDKYLRLIVLCEQTSF